jgi:hypothetical protein
MRSSAALPLLLASAMFAQAPLPGPDVDKENALGALMAKQFRDRNGTIDVPDAQSYVERIVTELAAAQSGPGACCKVELYASAESADKPTTYPGGHLFVPVKLFFTSADEAAFVETLAHAVVHIRQRDWYAVSASNYSHPPMPMMWNGDDRTTVPLGVREEFNAREHRADEAAAQSVKAVTMGSGEFERIRDKAPLQTPRPSLLP